MLTADLTGQPRHRAVLPQHARVAGRDRDVRAVRGPRGDLVRVRVAARAGDEGAPAGGDPRVLGERRELARAGALRPFRAPARRRTRSPRPGSVARCATRSARRAVTRGWRRCRRAPTGSSRSRTRRASRRWRSTRAGRPARAGERRRPASAAPPSLDPNQPLPPIRDLLKQSPRVREGLRRRAVRRPPRRLDPGQTRTSTSRRPSSTIPRQREQWAADERAARDEARAPYRAATPPAVEARASTPRGARSWRRSPSG